MEAWTGIIPFSNNLKRISTEKKREKDLRPQLWRKFTFMESEKETTKPIKSELEYL